MKRTCMTLTALLALACGAQARPALETLLETAGQERQEISAPAAVPVRAARGAGRFEAVLTAMYDQPGTGELLVEWLRSNKAEIISGDAGGKTSAHGWAAGLPVVTLAPAAAEPFSYRYLAALIGRETAGLMLKDFPESAEKSYMAAARLSEPYFELGGTRQGMESIDGHSDPELSGAIRLWVENDPAGGVSVLKARGQKTLGDLEKELNAEYGRLLRLEQAIDQMLTVPGDPNAPALREELERAQADASAALAQLASVKAARAEFARFAEYEKNWFWEHQGSLR